MITGSCLCGKVSYTYEGEISEVALCHCSQCRQAQGGAFATNSPVDSRLLKISGKQHIKEYQTSDVKVRAFCSHCGSPMYSARSDLPNITRLRMGTIKTNIECENKYHIYTDSKASWHNITDQYPQFKEGN